MTTVETSSEAIQEQLFKVADTVSVHRELMRHFITAETLGMDLIGEENCFNLADVMAIAAESLAKTIALTRGDVDPQTPEFLSELIIPRLDQEDNEALSFNIDTLLKGRNKVDGSVVELVEQKAFTIASYLIGEARQRQIMEAIKG
jgi:hypothetical protein